MSTSAPTPATSKWDLALDGIAQLQRAIAEVQVQITDMRQQAARAAPMTMVLGLEARIGAIEPRVAALESGTAAKILAHMEAERVERQLRQRRQDRQRTALIVILILVIGAVLALAGVVVWAELRPR